MSTFIALLDVLASICNRCDCISLRFPDVSQMLCWMPWPDDFAISKCFFHFCSWMIAMPDALNDFAM